MRTGLLVLEIVITYGSILPVFGMLCMVAGAMVGCAMVYIHIWTLCLSLRAGMLVLEIVIILSV